MPSPHDKRDLPPPPSHAQEAGEGMMDFEYSPAPVVFDDWESLGAVMGEQPTPTPQHQQPTGAPSADWGMMQYFNDPRVAS